MFRKFKVDESLELIHLWTRTSRAFGFSVWVPRLGDGLVDSGFPRAEASLMLALGERPIRTVVHTHVHEDHIGNDWALQQRFGTGLLAPEGGLAVAREPAREFYRFYERMMWGIPQGTRRVEPLGEAVTLGDTLLQVIPTPGHCPDHVVLFDPERRRLYAGDLFLSIKVRVARPQEDNHVLIHSLKRVLELQPDSLVCTHKGLLQEATTLLRAKLEFLESSRDQILSLHQRGWPIHRIAHQVLGRDDPAMYFLTGKDVTKANFVRSFLHGAGAEQQEE